MLKIGVLGCGMIAERGHLPAIKQVEGIELHALYDPRFERSLALQQQFGAMHAFPTEEAFWASEMDAVIICTPAPLHLEHTIKAARHGKHILCEKPLAMTEADIENMIRITDEAGVKLYTGFTYRFSPSAVEISRLLRAGAIGEVRSLRLVYLWNLHGRWMYNGEGIRHASSLRVGRMHEGGPMVDCGVHQIDLARWWLDSEIDRFTSHGVWVEDYEAPDHMYLHMDHANGAHTMVEMSFSYNAASKEPRSHFQYELIGTDGVIRFNREEHNFTLRNSHGTQHLPWHPEKNFKGMYLRLRHALATGQDRDMPLGIDGLAATRIARAATDHAIKTRESGRSIIRSSMREASRAISSEIIPADSAEPTRQ